MAKMNCACQVFFIDQNLVFGKIHQEMNAFFSSEANIQAELDYHCRLIGLSVCLEYVTPLGRLDAAIFDNSGKILKAIVECKKFGTTL